MRTFKYIVLGVLIISLTLSSMSTLFGQKQTIEFLETYTSGDIISNLDPKDKLFQLIDINQSRLSSSKLGSCKTEKVSELWKYIHSNSFSNKIPEDVRFAWGVKEDDRISLFILKQTGIATERPQNLDIRKVEIQKDRMDESFNLLISFTEEGAVEWETLTGKNVGRNIAILIEGKVYAAPVVKERIKHGKCAISGNFSESEITRLKEVLEKTSR